MRPGLVFLVSILLMSASAAQAQNALDRYEAASEAIGDQMNALLAKEFPNLDGNLPDTQWDDAHRRAGVCILTTLRDVAGIDYLAEMLTALEATASRKFASSQELTSATTLPVTRTMTANRVQAITENCGMTALSMQRMEEAGTFQAMQN